MAVDVSPVASAFGTIATMAYNDSNLRAERRRQAKLDAYNKEVTERNYQQQQILNSASWQKQQLKDAGFNPAVSGDTPSLIASSPASNVPQTTVPFEGLGHDIIAGATSVADKISAKADRDLKEKELLLQNQKNDLELMRIQQERKLTIMRELVDLFKNGKGALAKEDLNRQLKELSMSISSDGLTVPLVQSEIDKNNSVTGLNNSNIAVNGSIIDKNIAETKKIDAETQRQLIANLFAPAREMLTNQKIEWDGKNAMKMFEKIGAETNSIELDNYKRALENYVSTIDAVIQNISPGTILPAQVQEATVDFITNHYAGVLGTMINDIKQSLNLSTSHRRTHYGYRSTSLREKLDRFQELTDKAIDGTLTKQELWYIQAMLGVGKDAVTIPLRK